jgi:hypothetical protein
VVIFRLVVRLGPIPGADLQYQTPRENPRAVSLVWCPPIRLIQHSTPPHWAAPALLSRGITAVAATKSMDFRDKVEQQSDMTHLRYCATDLEPGCSGS